MCLPLLMDAATIPHVRPLRLFLPAEAAARIFGMVNPGAHWTVAPTDASSAL
jgi:hypothetical protein